MTELTISPEALALMKGDPDFAAYMKQEPSAGDVHVPSAGGGKKPKRKPPADFRTMVAAEDDSGDAKLEKLLADMEAAHEAERRTLAEFGLTYTEAPLRERLAKASTARPHLRPHADGGAYSPFPFDPNAMSGLHPEQMRRFLGAMTNQDEQEDRTVPLSSLVALQPRVDPGKIESMVQTLVNGVIHKVDLKKPLVVRFNGKNYLADGHHRAAAHYVNGAKSIDCKFCNLRGDDEEMNKAWELAVPVFKVEEIDGLTGKMVFGIGSLVSEGGRLVIDKQGDMITPQELEQAFYGYMLDSRQHGEMHKFVGTGRCIAGYVISAVHKEALLKAGYRLSFTKLATGEECEGLIAGWVIDDADTLEKIKSGQLPELSIGGTGIRVEV